MMDKKPFVSVIIITRSRPKLLEKCLNSVFKQNYEPFEVIVGDSSDDNWESKRVVDKFSKTKYVYFKNGVNQMPESRNLGIENSKGEIVAFLDDDCIAHKNWMKEIIKGYIFEKVDGVGGGIRKDKIYLHSSLTEVGKISDQIDFITNWGINLDKMVEVDHLPGGNMSFRRAVIEKVGWFDQNYTRTNHGEEPDYCVRVKSVI